MGGLFATHTDDNKRMLETKSISKALTGQIRTTTTGTYDAGFTHKREEVYQQTTTEHYQYFGMTEAAAQTCATAIEALSTDTKSYKATGTPVGDSPMWNVTVTVVEIILTYVEVE